MTKLRFYSRIQRIEGNSKEFPFLSEERMDKMDSTSNFETMEALYAAVTADSGLCGQFQLENDVIFWELYEGIEIEIAFDFSFGEGYIELTQKGQQLTHWHPPIDELYSDLHEVGSPESVLVLKRSFWGTNVAYIGPVSSCKYLSKKERLKGLAFLYPKTNLPLR